MTEQRGQSLVLLVAALLGIGLGGLVLGGVARGIGARSDAQRAADLAALAGARAMLDAYPRLFAEPADPSHLTKGAYLGIGEAAAARVARATGESDVRVSFPDEDTIAPVRVAVAVRRRIEAGEGRGAAATEVAAEAEAELAPAGLDLGPSAAAGEYAGPFAVRQGKRMRPDVAAAFDRMAAAAAADGHHLIITSAYRSDAEQAVLWAQRPDPKWVAPPGTSLHRLGTELDLGPVSAYGWLAANATRFHFVQRYSWEPWHHELH